MEILTYILKLSIGGLTVGAIVIFLGKLIINKSSDLLMENYKNKLEILKVEHQIKFTQLHNERAQIIKILYKDFYDLEKLLKSLTSLFQGPEWNKSNGWEERSIGKIKEIENFLEENRIYFPEDLCVEIFESLEKFDGVIDKMIEAKQKSIMEKGIKNPNKDDKFSIEIWKEANSSVKNEIKPLRLRLADNFRNILEFKK